jgi:hypothetical protein
MSDPLSKTCIIDGCAQKTGTYHFCPEHWYALPLELRRRWWRETDYGKYSPSPELTAQINRTFFTMMLACNVDRDMFDKLAPAEGLTPSMVNRLLGPSLRAAVAAWRNRQGR